MLTRYKYEHGITFIDVLLATVIGLVVLGGVMDLYASFVVHSQKSIALVNLNMELQSAVEYMATELRRAGYWNQLATGAASINPFNASSYKITINSANDCITFAYDKEGDGQLPASGHLPYDDRFAFRLYNNVVQTRTPTSSFSCLASSGWENVTDTSLIKVTGLSFNMNTSNVPVNATTTNVLRSITITMTGQSVSDSAVSASVTRKIKIRNNDVVVT